MPGGRLPMHTMRDVLRLRAAGMSKHQIAPSIPAEGLSLRIPTSAAGATSIEENTMFTHPTLD